MKGPITLLQNSISIFLQSPKLFIGIFVVPGLLTMAFTLFAEYEAVFGWARSVDIAVGAALWILMMIASLLMAVAMIQAVIDPTRSIRNAYETAMPFFWHYILLSILVSLAVLGGLILLIVPGIIFMVWFSFSYYVLILEGTKGVAAMKRSRELVRDQWWAVFVRLVVLMVAGIIVGFAFGTIGAFSGVFLGEAVATILSILLQAVITPISVAYLYLMYQELVALDALAAPVAEMVAATPADTSATVPTNDTAADSTEDDEGKASVEETPDRTHYPA